MLFSNAIIIKFFVDSISSSKLNIYMSTYKNTYNVLVENTYDFTKTIYIKFSG